jgi:hypothetical protein
MDDRHFAASAINLMVQSTNQLEKKLNGGLFTAVTLGQNEASSLIDFNKVPVFRGDEIKDGIKRLVKQEVDRIRLIKSEIETFIAKKTEIQKNNIEEFLADKPVDPETNEIVGEPFQLKRYSNTFKKRLQRYKEQERLVKKYLPQVKGFI